jgi:hypothetical protein
MPQLGHRKSSAPRDLSGDFETFAPTCPDGGVAPLPAVPRLVADTGYRLRAVLKDLDGGVCKTRIAEPKQPRFIKAEAPRPAPRLA